MEETHKILVFTDMHGNRRAVDIAKRMLEKDKHHMVVFLGDISEKNGDLDSNIADLTYLVNSLGDLADIYVIFGNCDSPELNGELEDKGINLHNNVLYKGRTTIAGWGGSHPTPFNTPCEMSEEEIEEGLANLLDSAAEKGAEQLILLTHEPPAKTNADKIESGHVGSDAIRKIVEKYQPNVHVCGHIHEAKSEDYIDSTRVINVGPSKDGHFLVLHVDGEIKVEPISI
jgi:hypothetical protein